MERRYLPSLPDHRGRTGAYAQLWEGWVNPLDRSINATGRTNLARFDEAINRVEDRVGCYAILYDTQSDSGNAYVAYIGVSKSLRTEIMAKFREWRIQGESWYPLSAIYIPGMAIAKEYESDLIRYYAPPWNVRYS